MIAICTRQGAFVYDCSEAEADRRISNIEHSPAYVKPEFVKDGLDYDENGSMRKDMIGWLFMSPNLIRHLKKLGVSACYISNKRAYIKITDFKVLANAYRKIYEKRTEENYD